MTRMLFANVLRGLPRAITLSFCIAFTLAIAATSRAQVPLEVTAIRVQVKTYDKRDLSKLTKIESQLNDGWDTSKAPRWDIAASLGLLSKMVYDDDSEMLDYTLGAMGFKKWAVVKNGSMAAHVISGESVTIVVMRGTNPLEIDDWRKNIKMGFITYALTGENRYHRGFWEAFCLVRDELLNYLDNNQTKTTWLTGHSLGGAMATLCAVELECSRPYFKPGLVTFGQPRVADSAGAQWIDEKLTNRYARFVHGKDIVPCLPPSLARWNYAHAGHLISISDHEFKLAKSQLTVPSMADAYRGRCKTCGRVQLFAQEPVYQTTIEPLPLTQEQFDHYFPPSQGYGTSCCGATNRAYMTLPLSDRLTDHLIDGYLKLIRLRR